MSSLFQNNASVQETKMTQLTPANGLNVSGRTDISADGKAINAAFDTSPQLADALGVTPAAELGNNEVNTPPAVAPGVDESYDHTPEPQILPIPVPGR